MAAPVTISYTDLLKRPESLKDDLARGLGSGEGALGVILVKDLPPNFPELRRSLFHKAARLAALPAPALAELEVPESSYCFGWSHGKEVMNGRPDTAKGSFYANPLLDRPDVSAEQRARYPEYYSGNVWPAEETLPGFEAAFKALGELIAKVGVELARACDLNGFSERAIAPLIERSQANKARLLHYFPSDGSAADAEDDACGIHLDHSLLTGLCSAMYLEPLPSASSPNGAANGGSTEPQEVSPNPKAGLYIYPRQNLPPSAAEAEIGRTLRGHSAVAPVKVAIPRDCLAFQTGEALQVLTGGKLSATPHYVASGKQAASRETFAFFLQPDVDDALGGETFGELTKRVLQRHYA